MRSWIIIFFLVLCSCNQTQKENAQPVPQQQQTPSQQTQIPPVSTASCDEFVKKIPDLKIVSATPDGIVQISTDSNRVVDESTFSKWLVDFSRQIFASPCAWQKISIVAGLAEGSYLETLLFRTDFDLLTQGKISESEWCRRFEVKRVETSVYLLKSLKEARAEKEHAAALKILDKLLEKEPQNYFFLLIKANVLLDQKLYGDAVPVYQTVVAALPDSPLALFNLGYAQNQLGSFAEAITAFEKVLNLTPPTATTPVPERSQDPVLLQLVDASLKNNDLERAVRYLSQIKDVAAVETQVFKAQLLRLQNKLTESRDVLQQLSSRLDVPAYVLFDLTLACLDVKDAPNAKSTFEKLKSADPLLAKELDFLDPLKSAPANTQPLDPTAPAQTTQPSATVTPPAAQQTVDGGGDTDYADQPAETEEEDEGQKF